MRNSMEDADGRGFDLSRFKRAQARHYGAALAEIRAGRKQSHWMWFVFPQLAGLGYSEMSVYYGIGSLEEAKAYLADETLGRRLLEISRALLALGSGDAERVMGSPDDKKLRSSMTLFAEADPECAVFQKVLDTFFCGEKDGRTLALLGKRADGF